MNDLNKAMKILQENKKKIREARSHSTAQVDGVENQKYGRDYDGIPDVAIAAQNTFSRYYDFGNINTLGKALCAIVFDSYNGEPDTLQDLKKMSKEGYNYVVKKLEEKGIEINDDMELSREQIYDNIISYDDLDSLVTKEINDLLEEYNIPVVFSVDVSAEDGIVIEYADYTGSDSEISNWFSNLNNNEDEFYSIFSDIDSKITDIKYNRHQNNKDNLSDNSYNAEQARYYYKRIQAKKDRLKELQDKLAKTKNYNKSKEIQKEIDSIKGDIEDYTKSHKDHLSKMKNK